jgi:uroporphyrin-III C-methyltransferase
MLFGRAHEEINFLAGHGIRVEVVPGVTAALAASADLKISLTQRGAARSVTFVTPRVAEGARASSWVQAVLAADTAAIYMGAGEGEAITAALLGAGKSAATPVAVIERASLQPAIRFGTLRELPGLSASQTGGPALILMGEVYAEAAAVRCLPRKVARRSAPFFWTHI